MYKGKKKPNGAKDQGEKRGISSHFSIAWWFCRFLARRRQWCSLLGGRRLKWRRLRRERKVRRCRWTPGRSRSWCIYLCGPAVSARSPSSGGSRCTPCCPRSPTRSTAGDGFSVTCTQNNLTAATPVLTFPPVTEKLANMQYFSFLWPVYVFKHWHIQRDYFMKCFWQLSNPILFSKIPHLPFLCCSPTTSACCKFNINVFTASRKTAKHNTYSLSSTTTEELISVQWRHLLMKAGTAPDIHTHLSSVAARMYFPLGENLTNDTGGLSSSDHRNRERTVLQLYAVLTSLPINICQSKSRIWILPMSVFKHCPDAVSQIRLRRWEKYTYHFTD